MDKNIFYMLDQDEKGFFITIVDYNGVKIEDNNIIENDEIASHIKLIKNDDFFLGWDTEYSEVYLQENIELINYLNNNEYFVDSNFNKVSWDNNNNTLSLSIAEDPKNEDILITKLILNDDHEEIEIINENLVVSNNTFYTLNLKNTGFYELDHLEGNIHKDELERFLTIAFKHFDNLDVAYADYKVENGETIFPKPQIIIEKIDLDKSLFISIGVLLSSMDYDFLFKNGINKAIVANHLKKRLQISNVDLKIMQEVIEELLKVLTKLQKNIGLKQSFYIDGDNFIILQENIAKEFIKKELLQIAYKYNVVGAEKLSKYNIKVVQPKIRANFSYAIDFLEGEVEVDIEGEKFSIQDILSSYKKDSYIMLSDGTNALINKKYIDKLERFFKEDDNNKVKISFFDLPVVESVIDYKIYSDDIDIKKSFFYGINQLDNKDLDIPKINASLREYQKYGYNWLNYLMKNHLGGCLADDMGLGKTLQAIATLANLHIGKNKKSLIIMPKSLIYNWEYEIQKFCPELDITIYYGNHRNIEDALNAKVLITTYGTIRNDIVKFKDIFFDLIILDESQNIKNVNSLTTKAIMMLNSHNRIALSGTPIENNLTELYSLFRFLNPSMFGSLEEFNSKYGVPIQKYNDLEVIKELKKKISPFVLRRVKKEVLKDLPDKIEKIIYVEMTPEHKKIYEERRQYYYSIINQNLKEKGIGKTHFFILQALNELRHITSCPENINSYTPSSKKEILIENIREAIENNHKVLVFANFIGSIESICRSLELNNIKYLKMTGDTKNRQELVDTFQRDKSYKVFVMTLKTGGVGLNLTAADTIFIYDPWWNKTVENQAIDRAYRLGQDRTVFSYKLILKNTIEEKILKLQELKSELLDNLISDDNLSFKSFTEKDIEFILGK